MNKLSLSNEEIAACNSLLAEITAQYKSVEDAELLRDASLIAHQMPKRVCKFLNGFKQLELPSGACLSVSCTATRLRVNEIPAVSFEELKVDPFKTDYLRYVELGEPIKNRETFNGPRATFIKLATQDAVGPILANYENLDFTPTSIYGRMHTLPLHRNLNFLARYAKRKGNRYGGRQ